MPENGTFAVLQNDRLTDTVFALRLDARDMRPKPGQFVHIRCGAELLLRRPISVCDWHDGVLTLVVDVRGSGTSWLSERRPGDCLDVLGPLGNGYSLNGKHLLLVGGGIGVPPMLYAACTMPGQHAALLGFRSKDQIILTNEIGKHCPVSIATDDGSAGAHGPVTGLVKHYLETGAYDGVLACGPRPMLRAVAQLAEDFHVPCQVSLEERMGCGVGACLVCACKTQEDGTEHMRRVCKDGPVFNAGEVCWS
ncbi:dihydroorotate dehydrogenase electron transfer subunit [Oscillospiraceae bacterium CM]|nr:dihydroorotate dehydrogenase electron transfer subunit [Oscillospiraceae bacterium CM]